MMTLGFDTSNYKTSAAWFDGETGENEGRLLDVPEGSLGLRQSDALFQHVKGLPEVYRALLDRRRPQEIAAVGASTKPREAEESYMPCFLAGESQGRLLAETLGVPFYPCSHQQGHLAAAAWSAGNLALLDRPFLAWHLSGGTTEFLLVEPDGPSVRATHLGGTGDLSAGQLIDRTGLRLGLAFPGGEMLDRLAMEAQAPDFFPVKVKEGQFSLSGVENRMQAMVEGGAEPPQIAAYVLGTILHAIEKTTQAARKTYPHHPVLYAGGVASSRFLRKTLEGQGRAFFAEARYSADNALGAAILAHRQLKEGGAHG